MVKKDTTGYHNAFLWSSFAVLTESYDFSSLFYLDFRWPLSPVILTVVLTPPGTRSAGQEGWMSPEVQ